MLRAAELPWTTSSPRLRSMTERWKWAIFCCGSKTSAPSRFLLPTWHRSLSSSLWSEDLWNRQARCQAKALVSPSLSTHRQLRSIVKWASKQAQAIQVASRTQSNGAGESHLIRTFFRKIKIVWTSSKIKVNKNLNFLQRTRADLPVVKERTMTSSSKALELWNSKSQMVVYFACSRTIKEQSHPPELM